MSSSLRSSGSGDVSTAIGADVLSITELREISDVPSQLRMRQWVSIALSVFVIIAAFCTYQSYRFVANTVGKDTVPSIIAAEQIRSGLANAHTQIANLFLLKEEIDGPSGRAYVAAINQAHDDLLSASQNITFGDEERKPILSAMKQLSEYERLVGMAMVSKDPHDLILKADGLMRERLLPSVTGLDQVNFKHLTESYTNELETARRYFIGFLLLSALLVIVMLETQVKLYREFKRILNPAMLLGLTVFLASTFLMMVQINKLTSELRTAKADAFDSVHALSLAQAIAYSANAQESIFLLMNNKEIQTQQTTLFMGQANQIFTSKMGAASALIANPKDLKGRGFLGDELANITFPGEHQAAADSLKAWVDYVAIDTQIRHLENTGQHDRAVALCIGKLENQSDWAFDRFISVLNKTIKINQTAFDEAISKAMAILKTMSFLLVFLFFAPLAGMVIGIQQRLVEFRE